jgi:phosphatidylglycerol---prolipoprotein diacylglyceryl transferase
VYPVIPFGPLSLPTTPILALLAVWLGLDMMARYGQRLDLDGDDLWNLGLIALAAGLIVARLWHVVQYWEIYRAQPLLIISIRPGGLSFWPGLTATAVAAYTYMLWRALDPVPIAAAAGVGLVASGLVLEISAFLSGAAIGTLSDLPWALPYFGETRHPVALYRAAGLLLLLAGLWKWDDARRPSRVLLLAGLGYSLIRLIADAYLADVALLSSFRISQVAALVAALIFSLLLARAGHVPEPHNTPEEDPGAAPNVATDVQ